MKFGTKAIRKDFYMEIRTSLGRFLSIFFIVALGVAFFSGIRSAEPDMRVTGDAYYDQANLMDIRAISTMGITEDDIDAIGKVDGVAYVEGGYSADFLSQTEDKQIALHVMSILPKLNEITVSEGRLPKKVDECLVDDEMGYNIGDEIVLESGDSDEVTDTLKTDTLKVVGRGNSPCYISFQRGSTTIGTGSLEGFVVVPEKSFDLDVYTEACVQVEGAEELSVYTEEYDNLVEDVVDRIEAITGSRSKIRKEELVADAQEELDEAKKELEDGKKEAQEELSKAEQELTDGRNQLEDAKNQVASGRQQIAEAKATLTSKEKELADAQNQYTSGKKAYEDGLASYNSGKSQYDEQKAAYDQQVTQVDQQFAEQKQNLDQLKDAVTSLQNQLSQAKNERDTLTQQRTDLQQQIEALDRDDPDYETDLAELEEKLGQIETGIGQADEGIGKLETELATYEGQYNAGSQAYEAARADADAQLAVYKNELDKAAAELSTAKAKLDSSKKQLDQAQSQIQSGKSQIAAGWSELNTQEANLESAQTEIAENEQKLIDGEEEYQKAKKEAEEEIADGEEKIADGEDELADLENPKWYIYDRSSLPEHSGYGENADRMKAIGKVFPILFFLVAALISLTSMTRMVEEQRTEIGTLKALGYSKFTIAGKYLGYAFVATIGGSIIGILLGEKILPYIIIYAYSIMYHHLPQILVPYNWGYGIAATLVSLACTMGATLAACYKELAAEPAILMRPPSPKNGRRVFLERITIIWRHLSFTWKSTIRNLMRYKKRFFMTVFGIGGCMALMLVGYGLRDSIFGIMESQYGRIQLYDGMAYYEEDATEDEKTDVEKYLDQEKEVQDYTEVYMHTVILMNGEQELETYQCVPKSEEKLKEFIHFQDRITNETYELTDEGVMLTEKAAQLLDVDIGDTVSIKDDEEGHREVRVDAICENYMGHYIYMTDKVYEEVYGEGADYNCIFFKTGDISHDRLEEVGEDILDQRGVISISYMKDFEDQLDNMLSSLDLVIVVLIISAGMLAFVVLYNLNNINITERQRELATLKVLGFYDLEVAEYVYRENIILTLIGALAGVGLGRVLHLFTIRTVEVETVMFGRNVDLPSYLYSLAFTIGFSAVVNWVMYFKLKRINMVESLKSIE